MNEIGVDNRHRTAVTFLFFNIKVLLYLSYASWLITDHFP